MNVFKKGLLLGGLLAAAAAFGYSISKEGKELSEEAQNNLKVLAKKVKNKLHTVDDISQERFRELVSTIVEEYAEKKKLATEVKTELVSALSGMWKSMESDYLSEKEDEE